GATRCTVEERAPSSITPPNRSASLPSAVGGETKSPTSCSWGRRSGLLGCRGFRRCGRGRRSARGRRDSAGAAVVHLDDLVGQIEVVAHVRNGLLLENGVVPVLGSEPAQDAHDLAVDRLRQLALLLLQLLIVFDEHRLEL